MKPYTQWILGFASLGMMVSSPLMANSEELIGKKELKALLEPYDNFSWLAPDRIEVFRDGKCGIIDLEGNIILPLQYDKINTYDFGVTEVFLGKDCGLVGMDGKFLLDIPKANRVGSFYEGLATFDEDDKYGVIDSLGRVVVAPTYEYIEDFQNGFAQVSDENEKSGYINRAGELVIPLIYDLTSDFDHGVAAVEMDDMSGVIDTNGDIVIPFKFDYIGSFSDGFAIAKADGKLYIMDITGKLKEIPDVFYQINNFYDGCAVVQQLNSNNSGFKYGVLNSDGELVIPVEYDYIAPMTDGRILLSQGKHCGFADNRGNIVIPIEYEEGKAFYQGMATVKKDGKWGRIDTNGKTVVPFLFTAPVYRYPGLKIGGDNKEKEFTYFSEGLAKEKVGEGKYRLVEY